MRDKIAEALRQVVGDVPFVVERPRDLAHGDYSTNVALVNKLDANELAGKLAIGGVERVVVVGKFINFYLTREALVPMPHKVPQTYAGKTVLAEYTDPNPFKEFHIGHLMSNAVGEAIARVLEGAGAKVARANYQGDVGPHVAKAIWGYRKMKTDSDLKEAGHREKNSWEKSEDFELNQWGIAYKLGNAEYERPDSGAKGEIDEINKKIYDRSDEEINALYEKGRDESLKRFEEIYKVLGTAFDHYFFESETGPRGLALVAKHPNLFVESEGAVVYHGAHTRVFVTQKGLPTYEAKEVGLAEVKQEKAPADMYLTITANEQNGFFAVVFEAIEKIFPNLAGKLVHRSHGMMRFAQGKMSSRTGNVITGESLLQDLIAAAKDKMQGRELKDAEKTAEMIAVGAIKYAVLKQASGKDIIFDPEKSLSLEGDSGPYLQYAHTRALSLVKAAKEAGIEPGKDDMPAEASVLERVLVHYPEVVERAAKELEPHYITTYLTEVAAAFNSWYAANRVIGGTNPRYGVWLAYAAIKTLHDGLTVLGIPAPKEM